jgi:hypothetical protein
MSISSDSSARRWPAGLRAWGGFRWQQFRSWQMYRRAWGGSWYRFRSRLTHGRDRRTWEGHRWERFRSGLSYGRADALAFAASVILGSAALVGFLTMERGSAPSLLGEAFTVGVTDEGVPFVALDPEGLGKAAQGGAANDGASRGSGPSPVPLFSVDTSGGVLTFVGGEGSPVGSDPQPPPGPDPGPGPNPGPGPSPGPSPSPTPPPNGTQPPPTSTDPPPTTTDPPPDPTTEPPPDPTTEPPPDPTTEPPPDPTTEPPPDPTTEPPPDPTTEPPPDPTTEPSPDPTIELPPLPTIDSLLP